MDDTFYTHSTAFMLYRHIDPHNREQIFRKTDKVPTAATNYKAQNIKDIPFDVSALPISRFDVAVASANHIYDSNTFKFHCYSGAYPPASFWNLNDDVYLSSPELLFCQLANTLPFEKLLLLGFELCGTYLINEFVESGFLSDCPPLTSAIKITKYANKLANYNDCFPGIKKAKHAIKYVKDNSASPQESRLSIIFTLPRKFGGFGLRNCILNRPVKISKAAAIICGQNTITPDISIPENKIAIEYDSESFHNNDMQNSRDKRRIDALLHDGWKVISIVSDQMRSAEVMTHIAKDILRANGQTTRIKTKNFNFKLNQLMRALQS